MTGNALADLYDAHYRGFREDETFRSRVREVISEHLVPLRPPPAKVLDVGCGNGAFLLAATELGYDALGFDYSADAAALCESRGLKAIAGDFRTHEFEGRFDIITFWDVLEHLDHPQRFLQRGRDLLRPGGLVVAKVPTVGRLSLVIGTLLPRVAGALLQAPGHVQYFRPNGMDELCRQSGFKDVDVFSVRGMRSGNSAGGTWKNLKRRARGQIKTLSGDHNVLVLAR